MLEYSVSYMHKIKGQLHIKIISLFSNFGCRTAMNIRKKVYRPHVSENMNMKSCRNEESIQTSS